MPYRVDRWKLLENEYNKFCKKIYRIPSVFNKNNIISCGLSFIKCIEYAKMLKLKEILICEDDIQFNKDSKKNWILSKKQLPNNWNIFLGGVSCYNEPRKLFNNKNIFSNLIQVGDFSGEHMILINSNCYDLLLNYMKKDNKIKHFDRFLGNLSKDNKINIYCSYPFISFPKFLDFSNIRNKIVNDEIIYKLSEQKIYNIIKKIVT